MEPMLCSLGNYNFTGMFKYLNIKYINKALSKY